MACVARIFKIHSSLSCGMARFCAGFDGLLPRNPGKQKPWPSLGHGHFRMTGTASRTVRSAEAADCILFLDMTKSTIQIPDRNSNNTNHSNNANQSHHRLHEQPPRQICRTFFPLFRSPRKLFHYYTQRHEKAQQIITIFLFFYTSRRITADLRKTKTSEVSLRGFWHAVRDSNS